MENTHTLTYDSKLYHPKSIQVRPEDCFEGVGRAEKRPASRFLNHSEEEYGAPINTAAGPSSPPMHAHHHEKGLEDGGGGGLPNAPSDGGQSRAVLQRGLDREEALRQLQKALCVDVPPTLQRWSSSLVDATAPSQSPTLTRIAREEEALSSFASPPVPESGSCEVYRRELQEIQTACRSWRAWLSEEMNRLEMESALPLTSSSPLSPMQKESVMLRGERQRRSRRPPSSTAMQFRNMILASGCTTGGGLQKDSTLPSTNSTASVIALWRREVQEVRRCYQILKDEKEKEKERRALRLKSSKAVRATSSIARGFPLRENAVSKGEGHGDGEASEMQENEPASENEKGDRKGVLAMPASPLDDDEVDDTEGDKERVDEWLFTLQRRLQRTAGFRNAIQKAVSLVPGGHCGVPPPDYWQGLGLSSSYWFSPARNFSSCGESAIFEEQAEKGSVNERMIHENNGSYPLSSYLDRLQLLSPLFAEMNTRVRMMELIRGAGVEEAEQPPSVSSSTNKLPEVTAPLQRFRESMEKVYDECFLSSAKQLSDNIAALEERYKRIAGGVEEK